MSSPLSVGQFAGKWCSYNAPPDLPYDQREEDGGSLVFDGPMLTERLEILGAPVVELEFAVDRPVAMVAVRLSDVAPDGRATRISYGLRNLTHRDGHEQPEALVPGERYRVRITLNALAQALPPGHRLRLAFSTSYWPLAWPAAGAGDAERLPGVEHAVSCRSAPIRRRRAAGAVPGRAGGRPADHHDAARAGPRALGGDPRPGRLHLGAGGRQGPRSGAHRRVDLELARRADERYSWVADDIGSVRGEVAWTMGFARGDWAVETRTRTVLTSTPTEFRLHAQLDAYERDERVFAHSWRLTIPRDLV